MRVSHPLQKLEATLKGDLLKCQKWLEVYLEAEKQMKMFKSCLTTQEIFSQQKNACQGLTYHRIPIPDFCAPKEQVPRGRDGAAASFPGHPCCCGVNVTWVLGAPQPRDYGGVPRLSAGCLLGRGGSPGRCCMENLGAFSWPGMEGRLLGWIWQQEARNFSLEAVGQGGSNGGEGR